jgi:3',5'-cyclic-AMP phosphodiesterase
MLIAQITDTHITDPGERLAGRIDSATNLARVIDRILALDTAPDCVLISGDLTDRGTPGAYANLRRVLGRLPMPVYAIPGNHDRREAMRVAFADCDWMPTAPGSRICYRFTVGAYAVLALDSLVEGHDHGELGAQQLDWLRHELLGALGQPTLIMLHHPPVNSGIAVMDAMKLVDADAFGALVAAHANVERVLCGHLHRSMYLRWRGTVVSVPVSSVEQLLLGFDPQAPLGTVQEPPGFQLHYGDPVDGLITHAVPVGDFGNAFFYP